MKSKENTPQLWDRIWSNSEFPNESSLDTLKDSNKSLLWRRIKKEVLDHFGSFNELKIIELGAGKGMLALQFALEGASPVLLDYSEEGIRKAKESYKKMNIPARFVEADILDLPKEEIGKYDVSISLGVAEHFLDPKRKDVLKAHFDVLKKGGLAIVIVPNRWSAPYRLHKFLSEATGKWAFGPEYPYSLTEFKRYEKRMGWKFKYFGGYLFFDPFCIKQRVRRLFGLTPSKAGYQIGTPLDKYFSHIIVAVGKKI